MAKTKKNTGRKIVIFTILIAVVGGLGTAATLKKREVPIAVQTEKVQRRNITELVMANGRIFPVLQVVINPEVSGEIIDLPVKEGQRVKKGDLLVKIKPDNYLASRNSAEATYKSALASRSSAEAELRRSKSEHTRQESLFKNNLISEAVYIEAKTAFEVAELRFQTAIHQADQAKAALARAEDDLAKTTINSPISGTVTRLKSQIGERVVGTAMMAGTEIMTIANLEEMEARVDIGEFDVVLIDIGQKANLEVEAFRDKKFTGTVTEIANSSNNLPQGSSAGMGGSSAASQDATKFQVKIRIQEKETFRPGMTVTAEIETRSRSNVVAVPIQSVTTRLPKGAKPEPKPGEKGAPPEEAVVENGKSKDKDKDKVKPIEVVFAYNNDAVQMIPVKTGIGDDGYFEITEGLKEGQEIVVGGFKAISRELEDGKKVKKEVKKEEPKNN